jgi:hypothetical protein
VSILDAFGNVVTSSSAPVSIALGASPNGGVLSGTSPVAANAGVATFNNLSVDKNGNNYTLVASSAGLPSVTSGKFNVH